MEPDFEVEPAVQLQCTPNGSLRFSRHGKTVFTLIKDKAGQLPPDRKPPSSLSELEDLQGRSPCLVSICRESKGCCIICKPFPKINWGPALAGAHVSLKGQLGPCLHIA